MKFMHLSDLHLGKRVNEFPMIPDQKYILHQLLDIAVAERVDAIAIAGDVYDRSVPSEEAVMLFNEFVGGLADLRIPVMMIAGNHDSGVRLADKAELIRGAQVYVAGSFRGQADDVTLMDDYGPVHFYLLPYLRPADVRPFFPDEEEIHTYDEAMRFVLDHLEMDESSRNVLLCHQNVTGALAGGSEEKEIVIGGLDNIGADVFHRFDYVALGHIHRPQDITGTENTRIRYCGTPLAYSLSEAGQKKSVTIVTLSRPGAPCEVKTIPLVPLHAMRRIRGTYADLTLRSNYEGTNVEDYLDVVLTDEEDVIDALAKLRTIYPNIMRLGYDNTRTRSVPSLDAADPADELSPIGMVGGFYEQKNGRPMSEVQKGYVDSLISRIWKEERL